MILEEAIRAYQELADIMMKIEMALPGRQADRILSLVREMEDMQQHINKTDKPLMAALQADHPAKQETITKLVGLMQRIQQTNQRLVPQIRSIMAVQQDELVKLKTGSSLMYGYHSQTPIAGRLIQNAG
ncbi:MAG: hypothetical protein CSA33_03090 [Desulfobulbus propionicus]|nr:MAG: hypothetical protein CSA33_03090 [Desulfobulbus propionicus]